jgi:hypothetical protein
MMKISQSVRDAYAEAEDRYSLLKEHVDRLLLARKEPAWHYLSRLKEPESFALKVETGRCPDPKDMEDFFACTIVVENLGSMAKAESLVRRTFTFRERRPEQDAYTTKPSDSFRFDDTRLYVAWRDDPRVRPTGMDGMAFEVQIKTFLAHAWAIATHDLTYKTKERSWPKERIAFQVKAMLEHAEVSIQEAQKLAKSTSLKKTDKLCTRITQTIHLLEELFPPTALPNDRKRLAENVDMLIRSADIDLGTLREVLDKETKLGKGTETLNLSPYGAVVQSLLNQELPKMKRLLTRRGQDFRVCIPEEISLPGSIDASKFVNAVFVGKH